MNDTCVLCAPDTFCANETVGLCPAHTSSGVGSAAATNCLCDPGHHGPPGSACEACELGKYASTASCASCPAHSQSGVASSHVTACTCNKGYTGADGGACVSCEAGSFKHTEGGAACTACPDNADGPAASEAAEDCWCNAGYAKTDGLCAQCGAGEYKDATNLSSHPRCTACPAFSYTDGNASTSVLHCLCEAGHSHPDRCASCPAGTSSPGVKVPCAPCAPGSWSAPASSQCQQCEADTYQALPGSAECEPCRANAFSLPGSTSDAACQCGPGYEGPSCTACVPGKFKTGLGDHACETCALGSRMQQASNSTRDACEICPATEYGRFSAQGVAECAKCEGNTEFFEAVRGLGECVCPPGYAGLSAQQCLPCGPGTTKGTAGFALCEACPGGSVANASSNACSTCPRDTFETDRASCRPCPGNSSAPEGSSQACTCLPGYPLLESECSACAPGTFEREGVCEACPAHYFSVLPGATSNESCVRCAEHSLSPPGSASPLACLCAAEFTGGGACELCMPGSFKSAEGSGACLECPQHTHWPRSQTDHTLDLCATCPGNSTSGVRAHGIDNCLCLPGFRRVNDEECAQCPSGTHCASANATQLPCPLHSTSAPGSAGVADCDCEPGFSGSGGACALCSPNTFCTGGNVSACPVRSSTMTLAGRRTRSDCVCDRGTFDLLGACETCPPDSFCFDNERTQCAANSTSLPGAANVSECFCDAGFERAGAACVPCPAGVVCGGVDFALSVVSVRLRITQPPAARRLRALVFTEWFDEGARNLTRDAVARLAGVSSASVLIQSAQEDPPGVQSLSLIVAVASLLLADAVAASLSDVVVVSGFAVAVVSSQAVVTADYGEVAVLLDLFPSLELQARTKQPQQCAAGALSEHGSCVCPPATSCSLPTLSGCLSGAACDPCLPDRYCSNNLATPCPGNETAPARSAAVADCVCLAGYYRRNGACEQCPLDTYCAHEQRHECASYDVGLATTSPGRTTLAECHCRPGHFRLDRGDRCRPCPLNYFCPSEFLAVACMPYGYTEHVASEFKAQCRCHGGFQWRSDGLEDTCLPCVNDRCGDGEVTEFCSPTRMPNAGHSKCVCRPGYTPLNTIDCRPCLPGAVKPDLGDETCTPCPVGSVSRNTTHCELCPSPTGSTVPGAEHCLCNEPFVFEDDRCALCRPDSHFVAFAPGAAALSGVVARTPGDELPALSVFHRGLCVACRAHSGTSNASGASSPTACVCDAGYTRTSEGGNYSCVPCPANSFEAHGACVSCGTDAVSLLASSSEDDCLCPPLNCSYGARLPPKLFGRHCLLRCDPVVHTCAACAPGSVKPLVSAVSNTDACRACDANHFQELAGCTECEACTPTRSNATTASSDASDCHCRAGHYPHPGAVGPNQPCLPCALGTFKDGVSNSQCQPCEPGSFSHAPGAELCLLCSAYSPVSNASATPRSGSTNVSECTCHPGSERLADACLACAHGSFKVDTGDHLCTVCGTAQVPNHYGDQSFPTHLAAHCVPCPLNSGQNHSAVSRDTRMLLPAHCLCFPHYQSNGSSCQPCPALTVKPGYSQGYCAHCLAGEYLHADSNQCFRCHLDTVDTQLGQVRTHEYMAVNEANETLLWGETQQDCVCHLGFERQGEHCRACDQGEFRGSRLPTHCQLCPANSFQDSVASLGCQACPGNAYTDGPGKTSLQDCQCPAGFAWNLTDCVACPPGSVRNNVAMHSPCDPCLTGQYQDNHAQLQCKACGANEWSEAPFSSLDSCRCDAGFGLRDGQCLACLYAHYSAGGSYGDIRPLCTPCPLHKNTSSTGSDLVSACLCVPGHGTPSDAAALLACSPCTTGYYAGGGSNQPCYPCGFGSVSEPQDAATHFDNCQCNYRIGLYEV